MAKSSKVEVIENPNRIAQKVRAIPGGDVDVLLDRVEMAMSNLTDEFVEIYHEDVERIGMHMVTALDDPAEMTEAVQAIRTSLHDLRGQAGTFGYQLVTQISDSACKFIDLTEGFGRAELMVLGMHVDALRAVKQQSISGKGGAAGTQLMDGLRSVIRKHGDGQLDQGRLEEIISTRQ